MLTEVCQYLHNWFERAKYISRITIADNEITTANDGRITIAEGQYFRIIGSALNDGVHQYPCELRAESFDGAVWLMGVPADFVGLVNEIADWMEKYGDAVNSPFTSESFGGYSYSKGSTAGSNGATWQSVFASRLNAWRKI
jgi:hypothetical protein